jgi:hypothetical protein
VLAVDPSGVPPPQRRHGGLERSGDAKVTRVISSRHGCLNIRWTWPVSVSCSRSADTGGRSAYRHTCSSRSRRPAGTTCRACRTPAALTTSAVEEQARAGARSLEMKTLRLYGQARGVSTDRREATNHRGPSHYGANRATN